MGTWSLQAAALSVQKGEDNEPPALILSANLRPQGVSSRASQSSKSDTALCTVTQQKPRVSMSFD